MPVWQKAMELSVRVFHLTSGLPTKEDYGLTSQARRAANSINGNIAEAFGRKTNKDKSHFYTVAKGSAYETQSHLIYGLEVGYLNPTQIAEVNSQYDELIHELNKILKTLR